MPEPVGEKEKARRLLEAVRVVKTLDREGSKKKPREPNDEERAALALFPGFGCLALRIFPNPQTRKYADDDWRRMGEELKARLSEEEYDSARRTVFNAFYTSPTVVSWIFRVLADLGLPEHALILEPGCGPGAFIGGAPPGARFLGVEMDLVTAKVAAALHGAKAEIRCENFRDTRSPAHFDAAVGNVPFADVSYSLGGTKMSLHNYFIAKAASLVEPGGLLGFVTSRWSMDSISAEWRRHMHGIAEFLGAVRLPSSAFKTEGTSVVTDVVFFRRRVEWPHVGPEPAWIGTATVEIGGKPFSVNRHFVDHPEAVLGRYSLKSTHYATDSFSVEPTGVLKDQLALAAESIVRRTESSAPPPPVVLAVPAEIPPAPTVEPEPEPEDPEPIGEGSFFVDSTGGIRRIEEGEAVPVSHGSTALHAKGTMMGRRLAALIGLRDLARRVLRSQNEEWSVERRQAARDRLNEAYDAFAKAYGPINKTTHSTSADGTTSRRMPNLAKFREDPDAMLVMALEDYDEVEDVARKAPILLRDVVGATPAVDRTETAEEALLVCLDRTGRVSLPVIAQLAGKTERDVLDELGDLVYLDPATSDLVTADVYLSGDVRAKLELAKRAGPEFDRNVEALKAVQPEDILPGDIDANLGAPWIPPSDVEAFAHQLFGGDPKDISVAHVPREATWVVTGNWKAMQSVAVTSDFGTRRMVGTAILELALNQRSPLVYDEIDAGSGRTERVVNQDETLKAKEKQGLIKDRWRQWVFADPDRARRLVRIYNDTFNNLRHRVFDGSHLRFPGMNPGVTLAPHQRNAIWRNLTAGNTLLAHVVGAGKAQPLDAKILTPTGWTTIGAVQVGDAVIAGDGTPTVVTGVFPQGVKPIFRVGFSDGSSTRCCDEHLWLTQTYRERSFAARAAKAGKDWDSGKPKIRSTREIAETLVSDHRGAKNHSIPLVSSVRFDFAEVPIDPYFLGVLLGNGCFRGSGVVSLAHPDPELVDTLVLPENIRAARVDDDERCPAWRFVMVRRSGFGPDKAPNPLLESVRSLGLMGLKSEEKFVPDIYKFNDESVRLAMLQGLMDTDGTVDRRGHSCSYNTTSDRLAEDVVFLVNSLGGIVHRTLKAAPVYAHNGESRVGKPCHVLTVSLPPDVQPFRAARKAEKLKPKTKYKPTRYIVSIKPVGPAPAQCISVAHPSRLYVTDDFIVTHNTYVMAATGMKMRQTGMCRKPMYVVPNHMLEQFSREFLHLYPNAKILQATKEDMTRDRRKRLTAKIATGDWDAIITTHSSFERIGLSKERQKQFFRRQIREYEDLLVSTKAERDTPRNVIKTIEKQKARREERLRKLMAETKKDDGLVFDELGVDHVFIDEAHYFKNLETPTKMERVAGIQTGGSERAFDILMKSIYLAEKRPGHGITFATGTPISNTMVETYTMQRFLDPDGLRERGIDHFDAWAASFGEVVESMEISPDGASLRPRSRFAKFVNLPELQQMFRKFADVQSAEMLNLPRPKLETGKPIVVSVPMSPHQADLQKTLVARYERIRSQRVDPKEDNALAITTDGRKLALDGRMLSRGAEDCGTNKIAAMTRNVFDLWERTADRRGTQLIFCDMGVNRTEWGFSAYEEVRRKLVALGIPGPQIADIGDADSDDKKRVLFDKVRSGSVRVLLGSTAKMGTGTNVQKRLVALHHLDAPWKPAEVEQREGRILRQGNENAIVSIFRYVTEGSFDAFMWQALETKARFIGQVMTGSNELRQAQDVGGQELSYAEVKAIASGNPEVLTLAETDAELQRLRISRKNHADARYLANSMVQGLPFEIKELRQQLEAFTADQEKLAASPEDSIVIGETEHALDAAWKPLDLALYRIPESTSGTQNFPIGRFRGLPFGLTIGPFRQPEVWLGDRAKLAGVMQKGATGARALLNRLQALSTSHEWRVANLARDIRAAEDKLRDYSQRTDTVWPHEAYDEALGSLRTRLKRALSSPNDPSVERASAVAAEIEALRESQAKTAPDAERSAAAERNRPIDAIVEMVRRRLPDPTPVAEPEPARTETAVVALAEPITPDPAPPAPIPAVEVAPNPTPRPRSRRKVRVPGPNETQGLLFI